VAELCWRAYRHKDREKEIEMQNITAIILAAGCSKRMGCFKPLLDLEGQSIIERVIDTFIASGVHDIRVVIGHQKEQLLPVIAKSSARTIVNDNYTEGMFSSVLAAINSLEPTLGAFFLLPADSPLVRPCTIKYLAENYSHNKGKILIPTFMGQAGHPPLIASKFIEGIQNYRGTDGLRGALKCGETDTLSIPVPDENILFDIDEPADYTELLQRCRRFNTPSACECEVILNEIYKVPEQILQHSRIVAAVAKKLTDTLNRSGLCLNRDLIIAAALLHDIAKGKPAHASESARIVSGFGYTEVASVIGRHTDIIVEMQSGISADEVLYLADKMVWESDIVSIFDRCQQAVIKYGHDLAVRGKIAIRYENALIIKDRIEAKIGKIDTLMADIGVQLQGAFR
jgi:molybdenum cofactor cytidylyltransferase